MITQLTDIEAVKNYLTRIGAEPRSLRTAVVKETRGNYWVDVAVITIAKDGSVSAPDAFLPTEQEASLIAAQCTSVQWPECMAIEGEIMYPEMLAKADRDSLFHFRNEMGHCVMIQQRIESDKGKAYVPWTYWSDGEWRRMEPEGKLPLYGIEQLSDHSVVFIHEGAKAARACRNMTNPQTAAEKKALKEHPWGEELEHAAHLGWIGGALSPHRTDWRILRRLGIKKAYVVSDNDKAGLAAVPAIAMNIRVPTFHVQFTSEWPASFDLADPFPEKMFKKLGDSSYYVGPSFRSCLHPATWATDQIPQGRGRPATVLRDEFASQWAYVEEADLFVCIDMPEIIRTEPVMNKMLASFSHSNSTGQLIVRNYRGRKTKLCYRPDNDGRIVTDKTTSAINLHTPTHIKPMGGDTRPWEEFLEYMFPDADERYQVKRWCATLIARPDVRMEYGLLLVSETQGIGKTTLGEKILAPLVGEQNVGFPTEDDLVNSGFNGWLANKRLVVVGEIYSGHSWKAYNKLKGYITDKAVEVNQKYIRPYRIENWVHILAASNSRKALKMEENDRRWYYPEVSERRWPKNKFGELNEWLMGGGLQIIADWAHKFDDYVMPGDRAPMTKLKKELINNSRSEGQQELSDLCEALVNDESDVALAMKEITAWLRVKVNGRMFDTEYELRKTAKEKGFKDLGERIKIGSQMQYVIMTPKLAKEVEGLPPKEKREAVRRKIIAPHDLTQQEI